jgi:hypothetical protein
MKIYLGYAKTYRDKIYPKPHWMEHDILSANSFIEDVGYDRTFTKSEVYSSISYIRVRCEWSMFRTVLL